jgi:hypothetical protein
MIHQARTSRREFLATTAASAAGIFFSQKPAQCAFCRRRRSERLGRLLVRSPAGEDDQYRPTGATRETFFARILRGSGVSSIACGRDDGDCALSIGLSRQLADTNLARNPAAGNRPVAGSLASQWLRDRRGGKIFRHYQNHLASWDDFWLSKIAPTLVAGSGFGRLFQETARVACLLATRVRCDIILRSCQQTVRVWEPGRHGADVKHEPSAKGDLP